MVKLNKNQNVVVIIVVLAVICMLAIPYIYHVVLPYWRYESISPAELEQMNPVDRLEFKLRIFEWIVKTDRIEDLSLTIFFERPYSIREYPQSIERFLFNASRDSIGIEKYEVDGIELKKHKDVLQKISCDNIKIHKKDGVIDTYGYFLFKYKGEPLFFVSLWKAGPYGINHYHGSSEDILINGVEVEANYELYDVLMLFLNEESAYYLNCYITDTVPNEL